MTTRTTYDDTSTPNGPDFMGEYSRHLKTLFDGSCLALTNVAGTDTVTADLDPELDSDGLVDGMRFVIQWSATNTGGVTLNINGGGAVNVLQHEGSALEAGAVQSGDVAILVYMGGSFRVVSTLREAGAGSGQKYWQYTANATWTKQSWLNDGDTVMIEAWGGGGGNSGGGGAYISQQFRAADVPTSLTIVIGDGGSGDGGNTTVGSLVTAYAGGGGGGGNGGGGAGSLQAGGTFNPGAIGGGAGGEINGTGSGENAKTDWGGGGGGADSSNGGKAAFGGGGGGGNFGGIGGTSLFGGDGGGDGVAGTAPGGGGGHNAAGARGEVRIRIL